MFVGILAGAILYGAVTLVFLILSSAELLESCTSTPSRLALVFLISVFWPVALVVLSLVAVFARLAGSRTRSRSLVGGLPYGSC